MLAYSANASAKYGRRNRNISRPTHRSAYQNRQYSNLRLTAKSAEKVTETVIYETMEGYALEPYRGTGIAQARITGILLDKYTPKQFKELTKDNDAYAAASVAALEELKQQVGFVNGLRTFSLDKLNQVELQQLDTITAGKVKGFEDMTDVDRDTKRTEVLMDLISQRDQLQGVDLSLYDENGIKEKDLPTINEEEKIYNRLDIGRALEDLCEVEQKIVFYRFFCGYTQNRVALTLNMTQVQVSRAEKKILLKEVSS